MESIHFRAGHTQFVVCLAIVFLSQIASMRMLLSQENAPEPTAVPSISITEFAPQSSIVTKQTPLLRATFPVVDIHTHLHHRTRQDPNVVAAYIDTMDRNNIAVSVSLDGKLGETLNDHMRLLWTDHRDRFVIFANIDFQGKAGGDDFAQWACNQPDFVRHTCEQLRSAKEKGISGLKFFKQFGLGYRNADGSLIRIDDERWNPIWKTCGELGIPVIMHTADPSAFFRPIDASNERAEELLRHPDWSFAGEQFPSRSDLHAARNQVIERFPQTIFIAAHFGNDAEDLKQAAGWLDQYPNLYLEFASRISELGRQPYSARRFLIEYQDRVMFGTDGPFPAERLHAYWRFLETFDENFDYSEKTPPPQGLWRIHGIGLPDEVLKKIYYENAAHVIPGVSERVEKYRAAQPTDAQSR